MATRGRHTRDDGQKEFTGRVRRWRKVWVASKEPKSKELKFQRWLQTGAGFCEPPDAAGGMCWVVAATVCRKHSLLCCVQMSGLLSWQDLATRTSFL
jgi:hypothetical protein